MPQEVSKQLDMFTGEPVDTRSRSQKRRDHARTLPQQSEMFSQHDIAQFGLTARPFMPLETPIRLALIQEDPRTPEEIERDLQRQAEALTGHLFPDTPAASHVPLLPAWCATTVWEQTIFRPAISPDPNGKHHTLSALLEQTTPAPILLLTAGETYTTPIQETPQESHTDDEELALYRATQALNLAYSLL